MVNNYHCTVGFILCLFGYAGCKIRNLHSVLQCTLGSAPGYSTASNQREVTPLCTWGFTLRDQGFAGLL